MVSGNVHDTLGNSEGWGYFCVQKMLSLWRLGVLREIPSWQGYGLILSETTQC